MHADAPTRKRSLNAERSEATRSALIASGRRLFAERGYGGTAAEDIVRDAGLTRGALYHHFGGKRELLDAVFVQVESELTERIATVAMGGEDPASALEAGAEAFIDACLDPEVQRIVLLDAPAVLGRERWREVAAEYGLGLIEGVLKAGMEAGAIAEQPAAPLAQVLMGALDEAGLYVAQADDPATARDEALGAVRTVLGALWRA